MEDQAYRDYIQSLKASGKLDTYLERSVSYISMCDLRKALNEEVIQNKVKSAAGSIKKYLLRSTGKDFTFLSTAGLYRRSEKEGVELTVIWLLNKLKTIDKELPKGLDSGEAKSKLVKLIAGVVMYQLDEIDSEVRGKKRALKLDEAIRLGYAYGLTYPFVNDLLDSDVLTEA